MLLRSIIRPGSVTFALRASFYQTSSISNICVCTHKNKNDISQRHHFINYLVIRQNHGISLSENDFQKIADESLDEICEAAILLQDLLLIYCDIYYSVIIIYYILIYMF
jgi:hypothetical protein